MRKINIRVTLSLALLGVSIFTVYIAGQGSTSATFNVSTELVSFEHTNIGPTSGTTQQPQISDDGNRIVFLATKSDILPGLNTDKNRIVLRDMKTSTNHRVAVSSIDPSADNLGSIITLSENGRFVLFSSGQKNFINGSSGTGANQIFLRDTKLNTTELISANTNGDPGDENSGTSSGAVSNDGRFVMFTSKASNLTTHPNPYRYTRIYIKDRLLNSLSIINKDGSGNVLEDNMSNTNNSLSCDGAFAAFVSNSSGLQGTSSQYNIYLIDMRNGFKISNITTGADKSSDNPYMSCNGNYIVFRSDATNLVDGHMYSGNHLYVYNRLTEETQLVDQSTSGVAANSYFGNLPQGRIVSDNGKVVFASVATNLITDPIGNIVQVFVRDLNTNTTNLVSAKISGTPGGGFWPTISKNGKYVTYHTSVQGIIPETFSYNQILRAKLNW